MLTPRFISVKALAGNPAMPRDDIEVGRHDQQFLNAVGLYRPGQFHDLGIGRIDGPIEGVVFRRWPQFSDEDRPNSV